MKKAVILLAAILFLIVSVALAATAEPEPTLIPVPGTRGNTDPNFDYYALMQNPDSYYMEYYWIVGNVVFVDESEIEGERFNRRLIAYVAVDNNLNQLICIWLDRPEGQPPVKLGDEIGFHGMFTGNDTIHFSLGEITTPFILVLDNVYAIRPE